MLHNAILGKKFGVGIRFLVEVRDAFLVQILLKNNGSIVCWTKPVKLKKFLPVALVCKLFDLWSGPNNYVCRLLASFSIAPYLHPVWID